MSIILTILAIIIFSFILKIIISQSYNLFFMLMKKPFVWIFFICLVGLLYFFIGSKFNNSINIIWWSATFAFILSIPPSNKTLSKEEKNKIVDEIYHEVGIKNGRNLFKIGLALYVLSCIAGWLLFYGQAILANQ